MLYVLLAGPDGLPVRESVRTQAFSAKLKMKRALAVVCENFDKFPIETRLWFRMRATKEWKLVPDLEQRVEDLELFDGDSLLLEVSANSKSMFFP